MVNRRSSAFEKKVKTSNEVHKRVLLMLDDDQEGEVDDGVDERCSAS